MAIDKNTLHIRAGEVAESLKSHLKAVTGALSDHMDDLTARQAELLRQTVEDFDKKQSARDSTVLAEVAAKTKSMREDVERFGKEGSAAVLAQIEATATQLRAEIQTEKAALKADIEELMAAADRSNFEQLEALIRGKVKG